MDFEIPEAREVGSERVGLLAAQLEQERSTWPKDTRGVDQDAPFSMPSLPPS